MIIAHSNLRRLAVAAVAMLLCAGSVSAQQPQPPAPILTGTGPNGATLRCRDGSYPAPKAADSACDGKGGVLVRFPMRATPQQAVAPERPAAAAARSAVADSAPPRPAGFVPWRERRAAAAAETERQRPPAGASLRCGDGSWIVRDTSSARCASKGGVTLRVTQPRGRGGDK